MGWGGIRGAADCEVEEYAAKKLYKLHDAHEALALALESEPLSYFNTDLETVVMFVKSARIITRQVRPSNDAFSLDGVCPRPSPSRWSP